jgi:isopentenyldiphosphate isomerase
MTFKELEFTETAKYAQPLLRKADEWESCYVTFNVGDVKVQCTEARKNTE